MNLSTIAMKKSEARDRYYEYRSALRDGVSTAEDEMLRASYLALSRGKQVISLTAAMRAAGVGNDGYPLLAIVRADALECRVEVQRVGGTNEFGTVTMKCGAVRKGEEWTFPRGTFTGRLPQALLDRTVRNGEPWQASWVHASAMVPIIPPALRPAKALLEYSVLWEVEPGGWVETGRDKAAPKDPALLRHLGGDLYAIVAVWDLTPIERAVIAGTRR